MRFFFLTLVFFTICSCEKKKIKSTPTPPSFQKIPLERLTQSPPLSGELPRNVEISPDGNKITFLKGKPDDSQILDLWEYNIETGVPKLLIDSGVFLENGEEKVSDEERASRERLRINSKGIISYQWSKDGKKILFPINGDLYLYQVDAKKPVKRLTKSEAAELDPQISPLGNFVSFVRNNNVHLINLKTGQQKALTFKGSIEQPMGTAEFVAQEEMHRFRGYWWSPDEKFMAVAHVDNRPIKEMERFEIYSNQVKVVKQRYPKTGTPNAIVQLKVFSIESAGQKQRGLLVPIQEKDYYIPQVRWTEEASPRLLYSVQNREQTTLELFLFSPVLKTNQFLLQETDEAWVNIRQDYQFLKNSKWLLWVSDRGGHNHIYKISLTDGQIIPLTSGHWEVAHLSGYHNASKNIFFTATHTKKSPLEQHLYSVNLESPEPPQLISQGEGFHLISMAKKPTFYLDYYSTPSHPPSLAVHDLNGQKKFFIDENRLDEKHPLYPYLSGLSKWEFGTFKRESKPDLYYKILKPKNFDPFKKYPLIHSVYGGPGVQLVNKAWSRRALFQQALAQKGFIVLVSDNQGTPGRGRDFEKSYKNQFGQLEVEDQSELLKYLIEKNSFIDPDRIGIYGHSYGGYLTLMLMMQKPDLYKVGVSGAPVVDWNLYDTHYTERYIGTPKNNLEVYKKSNVLSYTDQLKGSLLVVHGMADDNVLYNNSLMLYSSLQEKGKLFDIQAYPGAKHGIRRKKAWEYHYKLTTLNYFERNL